MTDEQKPRRGTPEDAARRPPRGGRGARGGRGRRGAGAAERRRGAEAERPPPRRPPSARGSRRAAADAAVAEAAAADAEDEDDEFVEETPRVKPEIPGMDLEVDIVREGEEALREDDEDGVRRRATPTPPRRS